MHGTPDVVEHYRRRRDAVARALSLASSTPAAAAPAASAPHAAPPSLREFLSENSILVLSSLGAFLLIVATVLFELYGGTGVPGWLRFGAVLALALAFGGAGWACLRSVPLKVVGQTYVAIFALMAPLSGMAAYVFLELGAQGITRDEALAIIGISSAVLYAVLALKLESRAYAVLSLVAFPIGLVGTLNVLVVPEWRAVGLSLLVPLYVIAAHTGRRRDPFSQVAEPFVHVAAVVAVLWAVGSSGSPDPFSWPTTITLTVIGAGYVPYALQARRPWGLAAAAVAAGLALLSASDALGLGQTGTSIVLVGLAAAYGVGSQQARDPLLRALLLIAMGVAGLGLLPLHAQPDWLEALVLVAAAGVTTGIALWSREPAWLLLATFQFAVAWYWLAKAALPPPAHPTADTLLLVYSPLPVIYGLGGLAVRVLWGRRWAWPLYAAGAAGGLLLPSIAAGYPDLELAGRALLAYSVLAYTVGSVERSMQGQAAAIVAAAVGLAALLGARSAEAAWYPAVLGAFFAGVYALTFVWRRRTLRTVIPTAHRALGLAGLAVTAAACFAVPGFVAQGAPGGIVSLLVLVALAIVLVVDGRAHDVRVLDYAAVVVAATGIYWLDRYLGVANPQWYVIGPGVALVGTGLRVPHDPHVHAQKGLGPIVAAAGAGLLMLTSIAQSVPPDPLAWFYVMLAVLEAVAALVVGIGTRTRVLVVMGGGGAGVVALRAMFLLLQQGVALFVVFGAVALGLLAIGASLALLRDRLRANTSPVASWRDWN